MKGWFLANLALMVKSLKKVEDNLDKKYEKINEEVLDRLSKIVDGKDGRDGKDGSVGPKGDQGFQGLRGKDGKDGKDGDSVVDARIDFDGSLVITMSTGKEINVGEVVSEDLRDKLKVFIGNTTGPKGDPGEMGPIGFRGEDGVDGEDGLVIPGPTGPAGAAGSPGIAGRDGIGIPGSDGIDGEDAPIIPGTPGATGATGNTGATGSIGAMGPIGVQGEDGEDGLVVPGPAGARGLTGATGSAGIGIPGVDGEDGETSIPMPGIPGPAGINGRDGRDGVTVVIEPEYPEDPQVIPGPAGNSSTPAANSITRAMLSDTAVTGGKNWVFLGQATASGTTATGTISWAGQFSQLMLEYYISGYAANGIGRICIANSGTPVVAATTACTALMQGATVTTTSVSCAGWPTAVTVNALPRYGWMFIDNQNGGIKRMTGNGITGGTAPTVVPTLMQMGGMSSQTTLIQSINMVSYNAITGNVLGGAFTAGTNITLWGRNDD